jgi:hypothetical protein
MEKEPLEYEDWTLPKHISNFLLLKIKERAQAQIEDAHERTLDDDEMRQIEPGQNFGYHNFF